MKTQTQRVGALALVILLLCASCSTPSNSGSSASPNDSSGLAVTTSPASSVSPEVSTPPTAENCPLAVELPFPSSEAFSLSGIDAVLYDAAAQWYSSRGGLFHLLIPSLALIGEYKNEAGDTCYICLFKHCDYYNLAFGLSDKTDPQYRLSTDSKGIPTRFTISTAADGSYVCTEIFERVDGADADASIEYMCGPLTELAEDLKCGKDIEIVRQITSEDPVELLQSYLDFYFAEDTGTVLSSPP